MSSTVDLKEKKRVFLESIDTSNGPNTMKMKKKNEMGADFLKLKRQKVSFKQSSH